MRVKRRQITFEPGVVPVLSKNTRVQKENVEMNDFESVKNLIIQLVKEKTGDFDGDSWEADYKLNWESELAERLEIALFSMSKMASARESGDDVMLTAALVHSRMNFMDLANFFRDIFDDLDALLVKPVWPDIPEGFDYGKSAN